MGCKPAGQIPVLLLKDLSNNRYVWNNSSKLVQKVLLVTSTLSVYGVELNSSSSKSSSSSSSSSSKSNNKQIAARDHDVHNNNNNNNYNYNFHDLYRPITWPSY